MPRLPDFLSFPPGDLGLEAKRLAIIGAGNGFLVIHKPANLPLWKSFPGSPLLPLQTLLRREYSKRPQFSSLGIGPHSSFVYPLDFQTPGPAVLALDAATVKSFSNDFGSSQWKFRFRLITRSERSGNFDCDLPLFCEKEGQVRVSHRRGKKCLTHWSFLGHHHQLGLWEVECSFLRLEMIRVHAIENGLLPCGENCYGESAPLSLGELKPKIRSAAHRKEPLSPQPSIWLHQVFIHNESSFGVDRKSFHAAMAPFLAEGPVFSSCQ